MIWFAHLLLHSAGLGMVGVVGLLARRLWRRDPVACHQFFVVLLMATLALPAAQWALQGRAASRTARWLSHWQAAEAKQPPVTEAEGGLGIADLARVAWLLDARPDTAVGRGDGADPGLGPDSGRTLLVALWLYATGLLGCVAFYGLRWWRTRRLLRACDQESSPEVLAAWERVAGGDPQCRRVRILSSDDLRTPACWGLFQRILVVPKASLPEGNREALEWALRHERVHLERGDARVALLQVVLKTLFWFHPVAWWLSRELDRLREWSCDHLVVQRTGARRSYALALLDYADLIQRRACPTLLNWSKSPSQLRRRIEMLSLSRVPLSRRSRVLRWGSVGVVVSGLWAGQLGLAATLLPGAGAAAQESEPAPQDDGDKAKEQLEAALQALRKAQKGLEGEQAEVAMQRLRELLLQREVQDADPAVREAARQAELERLQQREALERAAVVQELTRKELERVAAQQEIAGRTDERDRQRAKAAAQEQALREHLAQGIEYADAQAYAKAMQAWRQATGELKVLEDVQSALERADTGEGGAERAHEAYRRAQETLEALRARSSDDADSTATKLRERLERAAAEAAAARQVEQQPLQRLQQDLEADAARQSEVARKNALLAELLAQRARQRADVDSEEAVGRSAAALQELYRRDYTDQHPVVPSAKAQLEAALLAFGQQRARAQDATGNGNASVPELERLRNQIDVQRAQIEELKAVIQQLKKESSPLRKHAPDTTQESTISCEHAHDGACIEIILRILHEAALKDEQTGNSTRAPLSHGTVQVGDTLRELAQRYLHDDQAATRLLALNPQLDPRRLEVGEKVNLPPSGAR